VRLGREDESARRAREGMMLALGRDHNVAMATRDERGTRGGRGSEHRAQGPERHTAAGRDTTMPAERETRGQGGGGTALRKVTTRDRQQRGEGGRRGESTGEGGRGVGMGGGRGRQVDFSDSSSEAGSLSEGVSD